MSNWIYLRNALNLFCYVVEKYVLQNQWTFVKKQQLKYIKIVPNVRNTTPTCMALGELGTFPISIAVVLVSTVFGHERRVQKDISFNVAPNLVFVYQYAF